MSLLVLLSSCGLTDLGVYIVPTPNEAPTKTSSGTSPENAVSASLGAVSAPAKSNFEVAGYLPRYQIANVDPSVARYLTDLVYFTFWPTSSGGFSKDALLPSHLSFLREVKERYGTRILIGLTDQQTNGPLAHVCDHSSLRTKLADGLASYLTAMDFDGVAIDWEYPDSDHLHGYTLLLEAIHQAFAPLGLKLTVAISPSHPLEPEAYQWVNRVHVMSYDDWGRHSTLANAAADIQNLVSQGVEPSKLQLGVPFYGRGYTDDGPSWNDAVSYKLLQQRFDPPPNKDTVSGYYFNGIETVKEKVLLAKSEGLSGVMVWEIGQDTTGSTSLLRAISETRRAFN
ncbi:MAG: glycoside hydrolase family 18 protein [Spirochaetales bacterium]|nr:glycoside hydrolase family 18 protein [Spirochaetales bacterium]